ncbi:hypothetical protein AB9P05_10165 [Roseivirga sp. BDSF3-8]|uniref:hypothetical protein n=1 Tax=Roseivirga sp. BDSF3-8 TaxID=3241598 RepID=UPI00353192D0
MQDIQNILPRRNTSRIKRIKGDAADSVLVKFAQAISDTYRDDIDGIVEEISYLEDKRADRIAGNYKIGYALFLKALIGSGHFVQLVEVHSIQNTIYPVEVMLIGYDSGENMICNSAEELEQCVIDYMQSDYFNDLIQFLYARIESYRERNADEEVGV